MKKVLSLFFLICFALSSNAQLLWKISGKDLKKPSYIFGTYHLSPISIKDSIASMPQAINETTQVYGEVVMTEMMQPAFIQDVQRQMMLPQDTTLQDLFTPQQYELLGKVIKENMMVDIKVLAKMKPAAITQQLTVLLFMKQTPEFNPQQQIDGYFQQQASLAHKKVGGLETAQSQIDLLFNKPTLHRQAEQLCCLVQDIDKAINQIKQLTQYYAAQNLEGMLSLMQERNNDSCDPLPGEMEALLDHRNEAWARKIPAIMAEAPTLFVVGAGHLPDEKGILNLLKQEGYTIEALK